MPSKRKTSSCAAYLEALYTNKNFKWPKSTGLETLWEKSPQLPTQRHKRVITQQPIKRLIDFGKDTVTKRKQKKQARVKKVKAIKGWMPQRQSKNNKSIEEKLNALLECSDLMENISDVVSLKNVGLCTANNVLVPDVVDNVSCQKFNLAEDSAASEKMYFCSGDSGETNYASKTLDTNVCLDTNTINAHSNEVNNVTFKRFTDLATNTDPKLIDSCAQRCEDAHLDSIPIDNDFCNRTENRLFRPSSESIVVSWHLETQTERPSFRENNIFVIHKSLGRDVRANTNRKGVGAKDTKSAIEMHAKIADMIGNVKETYSKAATEKDLHSKMPCSPDVLATEKNVEKENSFSLNVKDIVHQHSCSDLNLFGLSDKPIASNLACVSVFDNLSERACYELGEYDDNVNEDMIHHMKFIDEDIDKLISKVTQVHTKKKSEKKRKRRRDSTAAFSSLAQKLAQAESAFSSETEFSMKDNN